MAPDQTITVWPLTVTVPPDMPVSVGHIPLTAGTFTMPLPTAVVPLLLPEPEPLPELVLRPPELLLPDPEPELPPLLVERVPLLPPEPDPAPDDPLLDERPPELPPDPPGLPPLEVLPFAGPVLGLLPPIPPSNAELSHGGGELEELAHSHAPLASAATSQLGIGHVVLRMVKSSGRTRAALHP
jgi:hypothetical protein